MYIFSPKAVKISPFYFGSLRINGLGTLFQSAEFAKPSMNTVYTATETLVEVASVRKHFGFGRDIRVLLSTFAGAGGQGWGTGSF